MIRINKSFNIIAPLIYISITLIFIACSVLLYWPLPKLAFLSDNSPISWLSSAQLWALVILSLRLVSEKVLPNTFGYWLCAAMLILAIDEQFMLHEYWKYGCINWFDLCQYTFVTELPMILVGTIGLFTAYRLHLYLNSMHARLYLWTAVIFGAAAITLDLLGGPVFILFIEEGLEVVAEAFFIGVLLGWKGKTMKTEILH